MYRFLTLVRADGWLIFAVDSCVPGDVVTVSGVVKVNSTDEGQPLLSLCLYRDFMYMLI